MTQSKSSFPTDLQTGAASPSELKRKRLVKSVILKIVFTQVALLLLVCVYTFKREWLYPALGAVAIISAALLFRVMQQVEFGSKYSSTKRLIILRFVVAPICLGIGLICMNYESLVVPAAIAGALFCLILLSDLVMLAVSLIKRIFGLFVKFRAR